MSQQQKRSVWSRSPILDTGATANVGRAVVREAARLGAPVRVAVRDPERTGQELGEDVERVSLDLSRPETYDAALRFDRHGSYRPSQPSTSPTPDS
jgi:NAD(P)-dependent dehydrogenase (short-subunit alcohol dehydrogenase family)